MSIGPAGKVRLDELASYVKSTNAGASMLTFDIGFASETDLQRALASDGLSRQAIHALYNVPVDSVQVYAYAPAQIIKITIPRPGMSGGIGERDFDGVQQFAPLLDIWV